MSCGRHSASAFAILVLGSAAGAQREAAPPAAPAPAKAVAAQPIRVLWLQDRAHFDFRYVRNILADTPGIELRIRLAGGPLEDATGALQPDKGGLDGCDVLLLGDLSLGKTAAGQPYTMLDVLGVLMRGGGVGFLCGETIPGQLRSRELERMLPVRLIAERAEPLDRITAQLLPPADQPLHPILKLEGSADPRADFAQLPSVRYRPTVQQLARDAQVLLCDPEHYVAGNPAVVAAAGRHGQGRTVYVGTDETWTWREPAGERFQAAFWRNVVHYLAGRLP